MDGFKEAFTTEGFSTHVLMMPARRGRKKFEKHEPLAGPLPRL